MLFLITIYYYVIFNFKLFKPTKYISNNNVNLFNNTEVKDNEKYLKYIKEYNELYDEYTYYKLEYLKFSKKIEELNIKKNQLISIFNSVKERRIEIEKFVNASKDKIINSQFTMLMINIYLLYLPKIDLSEDSVLNEFNKIIKINYMNYTIIEDLNKP